MSGLLLFGERHGLSGKNKPDQIWRPEVAGRTEEPRLDAPALRLQLDRIHPDDNKRSVARPMLIQALLVSRASVHAHRAMHPGETGEKQRASW